MPRPKPVISLHIFDPIIIDADEFEKMMLELEARSLADDLTVGDKLLARILHANLYRYYEIRPYENSTEA